MTIDEFRSNPGRADMLRRVLEMDVFQEACAAVDESNSMTEERAIATNLASDPIVGDRLMNQQVGRKGWLKDLRLCAIPIKKLPAEPNPTYGADEAAQELAAMGQPWSIDPQEQNTL